MSASVPQTDSTPLDSLLPEDINLPSIACQTKEKAPIVIPYPHHGRSITLGVGVETTALSRGSDALRACAFAPSRGGGGPSAQLEFTGSRNSFRQASSTHTSASYEHLDIQGSLSVGWSFLGASCQAQFNKDVQENRDATKVSLQYTLRMGRIISSETPHLSDEALTLLRNSSAAFHGKYGDYYLYALNIGAAATTFLSTSSSIDLESEMHDIQVKARILWANPTVFHGHGTSHTSAAAYNVTYSGFDTLSGYNKTAHATDEASYIDVKTEAGKNVARSIELGKRVDEALKGCGLELGKTVVSLTEEQIAKLCASGLVVEAMFLPYTGLRDYVAATLASMHQE